jgi:type IV secretory pathway VirB9-like protein
MCRLLHYNWDYVQAKLAAAKQNAKSAAGKVAKNTRQDEVEELEGENIAKRLNMSGGQ